MTASKHFSVQIDPEAGMDEKYRARIRIHEAETSFSEILHVEKIVPLPELRVQLHRLGFGQEQIDSALASFAHGRSVTCTIGFAPGVLEAEGFAPAGR